ncbi:MAG: winged helix-turn-helix domain-containing protein [Puniceicoccales bacterium]|jgi:DNA-binding response OmpR family regulator|nr:winged helix-turn-helix domain-containing protein [Puniceicoccales bacterium]
MQIRASDPDVPVLFISGSEDDEVQAKTLELHGKGAVDFVLKPCGEKAFHARIKKMARTNVFPFGPHAVIEKNTRNAIARIQDAAGHWTTQTTQLTPMLFELVTVFMGNKGRLLNKTQLLAKWGYEEKSLVQAIFELRKAIADSKLDIIKTLRGEGYIYNSPDA